MDYTTQYLTFNILGSGTIVWKASNSNVSKTILYSKNGGTWTNITSATTAPTISVVNGDVLQFKGDNASYGTSNYYNSFTATCNFNVTGNVMSLINSTTFASLTSFSGSYNLRGLFYGNTYLKDAGKLVLPATTLSTGCYSQMFRGCTGLTVAPLLSATALVSNCYYRLFYGCSSLNKIVCLATSGTTSTCTSGWVTNIASTGTFCKAPTANSWASGTGGIPTNWTVRNAKLFSWGSGSGNIMVEYGGDGNDSVIVTSSDNDLSVSRSKTLTFSTTAGSPTVTRTVTVTQAAKVATPNFILSDGKYLLLSDGKYFNVQSS